VSTKRQILFVATEPAEFQQLLQELGEQQDQWELSSVGTASAALETLNKNSFDVVLADLDLPDLNGVDLLDAVWEAQPKTVRFLRARSIDNELMMKCVWGTHRLLSKPSDTATIKANILRGLELDVWLANKNIRSLVSRMRTFPIMPSLYSKVVKELQAPTTSAANVAEIIGRDLAMTTKIVQVVNSAFYGLQRQITDLTEAIQILGMETVKSLILAIHAFSQLDKVKPLYFSIDKIWRHGMAVGTMAKRIVNSETNDDAMAEEAFTAGLLHDIGKIVLASNLDEHYNGAMALARKRQLPPVEVEAEIFGATHAETGAYLLALWGLPNSIVEATALHHFPWKSAKKEFSPLTAVHVANALEYEQNPDKDGFISTPLDLNYLKDLGLSDHLAAWRDAAFAHIPEKAMSSTKFKAVPISAVHAAPADASRRIPARLQVPKEWRPYLGYVAGGILALIVLIVLSINWLQARKTTKALAESSSGPAVASGPAQAAPLASTTPAPIQSKKTSGAESTPLPPTIQSMAAIAPQPIGTAKANFPQLTLQGIVHRPPNSIALINGKMVREGTEIEGVRIVAIERANVRVTYSGEEKTLTVKQ